MTPLLDAVDIEFSYGRLQVLFGVSLRIERGEAVALLGTNGAGKSTFLRVVAGLERPDRGRVSFDGVDVTGCAAADLVEQGIVLVPGGRGIFADMTVEDNLVVESYLLRKTRRLRRERWDEVFDIFPRLRQRLRVPAGVLSGGEQQQLALAKAVILEPKLLCIDELSLGLAPVVVQDLLQTVRTINSIGVAVMLVEQSLNIAASLCARAVFMEKGAVRFEGPTDVLLERDDVARAVFLAHD